MAKRLPFLLALLAAVVGTAVVLVSALRDQQAPTDGLPVGEGGLAVRASLSSRTQLFGELLTARLDLLVDRQVLDPGSISVVARFGPFMPTGPSVESRRDYDRFTRLRYDYELECLTAACVPETARIDVVLPPASVRHEGRRVRTVEWPSVTIASRYREPEIERVRPSGRSVDLPWRATARVPEPSYSVDPTLLTVILAGGALVLTLASLFFVQVAFPAAPLGFRRLRRRKLSPLERAIAVLERAHARGIEREQRLALDGLARELRTGGERELARTARELAWTAEIPGPERTAALAERVEAVIAERKNGRP